MTHASFGHCRKPLLLFGFSAALLLCMGTLQAQTPAASPTPAVDPGPRPTGNQIKNHPGPKFNNTVGASAQPSDGVNGGAGNLLPNSVIGTGTNAINFGLFWSDALAVFGTSATVNGAPNGTSGTILGLGPSFNSQSCLECHSQPAIGGSSPGCVTPTGKSQFCSVGFTTNPQENDAVAFGAVNSVPSFINDNGPIREARMVRAVAATGNAAAVPAGAVAELFVIQHRTDMPTGCEIDQIDFQTQLGNNNVVFRIPIPLFGEGFVEATPDATLRANLANADKLSAAQSPALEIAGTFNTSPNDQTISRFGWKAQNKSLLLFAGEAANVEMGVTNELFPNERTIGNGQCTPNGSPEDQTAVLATLPTNSDDNSDEVSSDIENFAIFMRLNASPSQCDFNSKTDSTGAAVCNALSSSALAGKTLFGTIVPTSATSAPNIGIGCVLCHTDTLKTGPSQFQGLNNLTFHPFSDFALHHMGVGLADNVTQGAAGPDQFRTAPLWGLGQRLFFLHDGRESDLVQAIEDHCPTASATASGTIPASEACGVITKFKALSAGDQQNLLNFLRSL